MNKRIKYQELKLMHIWRVSVFHRALLIVFFCNIHQRKTSLLHFTLCIIEGGNRWMISFKKNKKRKKIKKKKNKKEIPRVSSFSKSISKKNWRRGEKKKCMNETLWCFAWLLFNGVIEMVLSFFIFFKESRYTVQIFARLTGNIFGNKFRC